MHALRTEQLHHKYGERKISFPDITCESGEHTLLLGPSGCGKTTLLQLISGIRSSQAGNVWVDNTQINTLSQAKRDQFRGQHIGMIYQSSHFVRSLSVIENLALAQSFAGQSVDPSKLKSLLDKLNILGKASQKTCLLYTSPSPRDATLSRMPSSA